ncbi:localization factor PodJL [Caulobacter ginsengisoli]|uniref:Localization factor PodJL n=1 Tax=Caulobacter ginsengisoli TaxID=400775 RepID=A0ABU0IV82_9CAUL|nr:peptidoglycan-binding protein [Caulobacter ginsengisoli]MDQ0465925.1 localization factor PodJL [Caulobacter ginsengisoli]
MTAGAPWSVKGIDPKAREIAKDLARRSGMTLGEWLNQMIVEGGEAGESANQAVEGPHPSEFTGGDFDPPSEPIVVATPRADAPPRFEISSHPADEVGRVAQALTELTERIEAAEQRSTLAISGIDQSVRGALSRLDGAQREQTAVAARFEGLADDIAAEQARQAERLLRVETESAGPRSAEAVRALEGALGKVAGHLYEGEARTREAIAAVEARVAEAEAALGQAPAIDTAALVEAVAGRIDERLAAAETRTTEAIRDLGASFVKLDSRLRYVEGGAGPGARLEALASELTQKMDAARQEMAAQLKQSAEGRFDRMEHRLTEMAGHVQLAEQRSAQAIERMGREVAGMADVLSRRVQSVEHQGADAINKVGGEVARIAATVEQRLNRADTVQAQALEKLGGEIARITERLAERIANSERRGAQAIDEVGEQVARVTERISQRQERTATDLAERIRLSEERTARLLDEAREKIDLSLNASHKRLSEQVAQSPTQMAPAAPVLARPAAPPSPPPSSGGYTDPFADDPFPVRGEAIPEEAFASPAFPSSAPAPMPASMAAYDAGDFPVDEPEKPAFSDEDFEAAASFGTLHEAGEADVAPEAEPLSPGGDFEPAGRPLSTREVIEQARAAARANFQTEAKPAKPKGGGLFGGGKRKSKKSNQTLNRVLTGVAVVAVLAGMSVALVGFTNSNAFGPTGKSSQRVADGAKGSVLDSIKILTGEADTTPKPRVAVAIAPTLTPQAAAPAAGGQADLPAPPAPPSDPTAPDLYNQAVKKIEAKDAAGLVPLRKAAAMGYAPAQFYLAKLYENGEVGLKKDPAEARRWTEKAAQGGDKKAMHNLAYDYFEGLGGPRNLTTAADWFRRAADQGVTDSQYNLGQLYEQGFGVPQNGAEAYKWYLIAAKGGDPESKAAADRIKKTLTPDQRAVAERSAQGFRTAGAAPAPAPVMAAAPAGGVITAQKALSRLGYYRGPQDGAASPALKLAVQAYQRDQGLPATGALDGAMVDRLSVYAR